MPLTRFAMHAKGEQIHVAVWPEAPEIHHLASRHYAFEGRCFVICARSYLTANMVPEELLEAARGGQIGDDASVLLPGGSRDHRARRLLGGGPCRRRGDDRLRGHGSRPDPAGVRDARRGRSLQPAGRLPPDSGRETTLADVVARGGAAVAAAGFQRTERE